MNRDMNDLEIWDYVAEEYDKLNGKEGDFFIFAADLEAAAADGRDHGRVVRQHTEFTLGAGRHQPRDLVLEDRAGRRDDG